MGGERGPNLVTFPLCSGKEIMRAILRPAALACAVLLTLTVFAGPVSASPSDNSAAWLERQLTDGVVHNDEYGFDDYGLTADVGLALAAVGGHGADVRTIRKALAARVDSWTTGVDFGSDDVYAGSVAKAAVFARTAGADPRSFGGVDLVARLEQRVSTADGLAGRIADQGDSDYANVIGQAYAAAALSHAGSARAGKAVRFLLKQQCRAGYFRLYFADKGAADQTCDGAPKAAKAPDTDVTAISVLMLRSVKPRTKAVRGAITDAVGWLKRRQADHGGFGGGTATEAPNANSTGLAGWALGETGSCRPARKAARWVQRFQVTRDERGTELARQVGAIAYDATAFRQGKQYGIGPAEQDQWRRASAQAAPALRFVSLSSCRG